MFDNNKVLLLGSIPIENKPKTFGGATILVKSLIDFYIKSNLPHTFIQLNKYPDSQFKSYLSVLKAFFQLILKHNLIFVNVSSNGAFYLSPFIVLVSKIFYKKTVFRIFGSNFEEVYSSKNLLIRFIAKQTFFRANLIIVETNINKDFFSKKSKKNIFVLPNVRKKPTFSINNVKFSKKFVFVSHVKLTKGILDIVKAENFLPNDYTIDVFGPLYDNLKPANLNTSIINYKGVLKPQEVLIMLREYDVLLLPTYYSGEGHPGILIEAMSLGMPCISTFWNSIEEVVENNFNGFLVPVKTPIKLAEAMLKFNVDNHKIMSANSIKMFDKFDEDKVYESLILQLKLI